MHHENLLLMLVSAGVQVDGQENPEASKNPSGIAEVAMASGIVHRVALIQAGNQNGFIVVRNCHETNGFVAINPQFVASVSYVLNADAAT